MKITVFITMMLLISTLAINPAFGIINDQPEGTGEGTYGAPNSGDGISDGSGWDPDDHGAPNSGDGIPDGSGWDSDDPGASNPYSPFPLILFVG